MRKLLKLRGMGKRRRTIRRKCFSLLELNYGLSRFGVGKSQARDLTHFAVMLASQFHSAKPIKLDGLLIEINGKHTTSFVSIAASSTGSMLPYFSCPFYMETD